MKSLFANRFQFFFSFILAIFIITLIRFNLADIPLERDEGEFAYMAQLILQGEVPYKSAYNMKLPGVYAIYALIMGLGGQTPFAIRIGFLIFNLLSIFLVYRVAKRFTDQSAAFLASIVYGLLSFDQTMSGFSAHASHFVIFFMLLGLIFLMRSLQNKKNICFLTSGFFFGLSYLMKQHGIFFALFAIVYLIYSKEAMHRIFLFVISFTMPFALTCAVLWKAGVYPEFWFWTFEYAKSYVSQVTIENGLVNFSTSLGEIVSGNKFILFFGIIGIIPLLKEKNISRTIFLCGFFIFSFLALTPGFLFRDHYFIMILPAVSMLIGLGINLIGGHYSRLISILIVMTAFGFSLTRHSQFLFADPYETSRALSGANPFPEAVEIAKYIKSNTQAEDLIAVFGSEPQIYYYAKRHSATGFLYMYPLMENQPYAQKMQQQFIDDLEFKKPIYIVYEHIDTAWNINPNSDLSILRWAEEWLPKHYDKVALINILNDQHYHTEYFWGNVANLKPRSSAYLTILKRKP